MGWAQKRMYLGKDKEGIIVVYWMFGTRNGIRIHSRRNHIPHANGVGFWTNNTFHVIVDGKEVKAFHTLKDAKEFAEKLIK